MNASNQKNQSFLFWKRFVLLSACLSLFGLLLNAAAKTDRKNKITLITKGLDHYKQDCHTYPTEQQGLEALWQKPVLDPIPEPWNGPYAPERSKGFYRLTRKLTYKTTNGDNNEKYILCFNNNSYSGFFCL